jgi:uncharacterized protein (TIGR03435 family)
VGAPAATISGAAQRLLGRLMPVSLIQAQPAQSQGTQAVQLPVVPGMSATFINQTDAPAMVTSASFSNNRDDQDSLTVGARIDSKSNEDIVFFRMGWAYALPSGVEFGRGETVVPYNGLHPGGTFGVPEWQVPRRKDATALFLFLEEVALEHGTRWEADHKKIEAQVLAGRAKHVMDTTLPEMRFEVATIKPSPPNAQMLSAPHGTPEDFSARMATVESMIAFAYGVPFSLGMSVDPAHFFLPHPSNLVDGPGWVANDKYDLTAKADAATVEAWSKLHKKDQQDELKRMMRALLEERFNLTMRHETRELPVWALVVIKGGPKLGATSGPPPDLNDGSDPAKPFDPSKPYQTRWKRDRGVIKGRDVTIAEFGDMLWSQREIDSRKILDQTGLTGRYDLTLRWASVDDPRESDGPSLFTAIQEQLGLKLESTKSPMDVMVIEHIERPSAN